VLSSQKVNQSKTLKTNIKDKDKDKISKLSVNKAITVISAIKALQSIEDKDRQH
jgi:hypothetical protein